MYNILHIDVVYNHNIYHRCITYMTINIKIYVYILHMGFLVAQW